MKNTKYIALTSLLLIFISCSKENLYNESSAKKLIKSSIINGKNIDSIDSLTSSVVGIYNSKVNSICTGSLIAPNIVLTAAHCIPKSAQDVKIVFSTNIDETINIREQDVYHEFVLPAVEFKVHPNWNPNNETVEVDTGDIALIKFKGVIPNGFKPAIFLQDSNDLKIGQNVILAGFGVNLVDMEEIDPKKYRKINEAIEFGDVVCSGKNKDNYGPCFKIERSGDGQLRTASAPISFIHETEIRLNEKNAGTCNGDSGGPAYIEKNGIFYLFGVTSRGSELCNEVGVYTNALYYKAWINETIANFTK